MATTHRPTEPAPTGGKPEWVVPCECGWSDRAGYTPNHAHQITRLHAEKENKRGGAA